MTFKILIIIIFSSVFAGYTQQDAHYTQYMYNMNIVNPAYMVNEPSFIQVGALYRSQWLGVDGAPKSTNVFANIPINNNIELSVNFLNDKIGDPIGNSNTIGNLDVAYKINLQEDMHLAFGTKLGVQQFNVKFSKNAISTDPNLQNRSATAFNFGTGAFLFGKNYYAGLSLPNIIPNKFYMNDDIKYKTEQHLFLMGGYVFLVSDAMKLKPSAIFKHVVGAPLTFDVSVNTLLNKKIEFGVSYRYLDAIAGLVSFNLKSDFKIGYSYDYTIGAIQNFSNGSHELLILYTFDVLGLNKTYSSPRFY